MVSRVGPLMACAPHAVRLPACRRERAPRYRSAHLRTSGGEVGRRTPRADHGPAAAQDGPRPRTGRAVVQGGPDLRPDGPQRRAGHEPGRWCWSVPRLPVHGRALRQRPLTGRPDRLVRIVSRGRRPRRAGVPPGTPPPRWRLRNRLGPGARKTDEISPPVPRRGRRGTGGPEWFRWSSGGREPASAVREWRPGCNRRPPGAASRSLRCGTPEPSPDRPPHR